MDEIKVGNKMVKARQYPWGTVQGMRLLRCLSLSDCQNGYYDLASFTERFSLQILYVFICNIPLKLCWFILWSYDGLKQLNISSTYVVSWLLLVVWGWWLVALYNSTTSKHIYVMLYYLSEWLLLCGWTLTSFFWPSLVPTENRC